MPVPARRHLLFTAYASDLVPIAREALHPILYT
jgi:hypothetical protein